MKNKISKNEAREKIDKFFELGKFTPSEMRKIKRLAMKYRISLKDKKKLFCKKCLAKLKGKIRVSRFYKTVECGCGYKNKFKIY